MFINDAFASAADSVSAGSLGGTLTQLALILLIFYFLLIRPQQKKIAEHNAMIQALKIGDKVLTNGGIYGKITKIAETEITLEIAENVNIIVDRMSIGGLVLDDKKKLEDKAAVKTKKNEKK